MGSCLPGKEKYALWVVSEAVDDTDKGEVVEELNMAPTSWDKGQRGEAGRQVLSTALVLHGEACLVLAFPSCLCLEDKIPQAGWMQLDIRVGVGCLVHFLCLDLPGHTRSRLTKLSRPWLAASASSSFLSAKSRDG